MMEWPVLLAAAAGLLLAPPASPTPDTIWGDDWTAVRGRQGAETTTTTTEPPSTTTEDPIVACLRESNCSDYSGPMLCARGVAGAVVRLNRCEFDCYHGNQTQFCVKNPEDPFDDSIVLNDTCSCPEDCADACSGKSKDDVCNEDPDDPRISSHTNYSSPCLADCYGLDKYCHIPQTTCPCPPRNPGVKCYTGEENEIGLNICPGSKHPGGQSATQCGDNVEVCATIFEEDGWITYHCGMPGRRTKDECTTDFNEATVCVCSGSLCNKNFDPSWIITPPRLTDPPPLIDLSKKQLGAPVPFEEDGGHRTGAAAGATLVGLALLATGM